MLQTLHGLNWLGRHLQNTFLCKQDKEDSRGKTTGYLNIHYLVQCLMGICNHYLFNHIQKDPCQKPQDCGTLTQDPDMNHLALNMLWAVENMERILHHSTLGSLRRISEDSWMNIMNSEPQENNEEKPPTTCTYRAQRNSEVATAYKMILIATEIALG